MAQYLYWVGMMMSNLDSLAQHYLTNAGTAIAKKHDAATRHHYDMLRLMAKQRLEIIKPYIIEKHGLNIGSGPFAGMRFLSRAHDGCYIPKLLGCYEAELHQVWLQLRATRRYEAIIDIGAAEGYYAVGLARLFPDVQVYAHEIETSTHDLIKELAQLNAVQDRVHIEGEFTHADFAQFAHVPTLLVCDIEGAEKTLLDPLLAHELHNIDIVVELHPVFDKSIPDVVLKRFLATHNVQIINEQTPRQVKLPQFFDSMDRLDQLLAIWEYRTGPTPWAVMRARTFPTITVSYD